MSHTNECQREYESMTIDDVKVQTHQTSQRRKQVFYHFVWTSSDITYLISLQCDV